MAQVSKAHMREYETLYVLRPELDDQVAMDFISKMKAHVESNDGKHVQVTNMGRRKIAWERIADRTRFQKGMYVRHRYLGKPDMVNSYERVLKLAEQCILRQTVVLQRAVLADAVTPEEDTIVPPIHREPVRRESRDDRGDRGGYRGDRDRGDRDHRGDRDRGGDRDHRSDRGDRDHGGAPRAEAAPNAAELPN